MTWTWAINVVTVVCDLNKVGLKALIYILSSWCEMGWNLGFFLNEVVDKVSVTLFPRIIAIPQIIASLKHRPPPPTSLTPLAIFSFFYPVPVIIRLSFQKIRYCMKFLVFFSTTYTQQEYCIFSVPTAVSKLLYFITLQCTSWLNHLLSSSHKYCTSTYCLKYSFF